MKLTVFHVFFWVLVMWAVHSHGRSYETESIIYNNTQQPYKENLSTEMWPRVNFFYLVMLWRNSFPFGQFYCNQPWVPTIEYFVVHGLWPQLPGDRYVDCRNSVNRTPYHVGQLNQNLENKLNRYWPDLRENQDSCFRQYEYLKHGSCVFPTKVEYFQSTMGMMEQTHQYLPLHGITPGTYYSFDALLQRFVLATGVYPKLQCNGDRLYQVYFCVNKSNVLFNCPYPYVINNSCRSSIVVLP